MIKQIEPNSLIKPRRKITGMSAILLPFDEHGEVDWAGFTAHVERTAAAGLVPAVNMDTGYVNLIDYKTRIAVLRRTRLTLGGKGFVAGAFVGDNPESKWNPDTYKKQMEYITKNGGTPVIFQSYGLTGQPEPEIVAAYATLARECDGFIAFELGKMFAPFGKIYSLETFAAIMALPQCLGAKHSSLDRSLEWQRLALRNAKRPDFKIYTGNDLAIDMVMYGSDYLLGLSTFAPDLFAKRDRLWEQGSPDFYRYNDLLQYLGFFAFRTPVPAYKHSAAQFLKLRGWLQRDCPHPRAERRPESDIAVLKDILTGLNELDGTVK
ncbi:MAG: dihydrodipicolinate synthase family protein [Dehalococcoidales bacterium]